MSEILRIMTSIIHVPRMFCRRERTQATFLLRNFVIGVDCVVRAHAYARAKPEFGNVESQMLFPVAKRLKGPHYVYQLF